MYYYYYYYYYYLHHHHHLSLPPPQAIQSVVDFPSSTVILSFFRFLTTV